MSSTAFTFKERKDIPFTSRTCRVYEVFDADAKPLALWYCDYFTRDNRMAERGWT